ncbi:hypothetical protein ACHQM5_028616 [Ranunculus cassubicifolius]
MGSSFIHSNFDIDFVPISRFVEISHMILEQLSISHLHLHLHFSTHQFLPPSLRIHGGISFMAVVLSLLSTQTRSKFQRRKPNRSERTRELMAKLMDLIFLFLTPYALLN